MNQESELSRCPIDEADKFSGPTLAFTHPDDVLHSRAMSVAEKRAILAAWASDAYAVPNLPAMRQLDSGAIVRVDTILATLRTLDRFEKPAGKVSLGSTPEPRRSLMRWRPLMRRRDGDDNDEPPLCSAAALPPGVELELRHKRDRDWGLLAA